MSKVNISLESVQVTKGEGGFEGKFELNIKAQEGTHVVHWPDPYPAFRVVDQGGTPTGIGKLLATYDVASGTLSKLISCDVKEIDKGMLGADDSGHGTVSFELTPTMAATTKSTTVDLYRPNMGKNGTVKVTFVAQRA